jgi:hypothetical protein
LWIRHHYNLSTGLITFAKECFKESLNLRLAELNLQYWSILKDCQSLEVPLQKLFLREQTSQSNALCASQLKVILKNKKWLPLLPRKVQL